MTDMVIDVDWDVKPQTKPQTTQLGLGQLIMLRWVAYLHKDHFIYRITVAYLKYLSILSQYGDLVTMSHRWSRLIAWKFKNKAYEPSMCAKYCMVCLVQLVQEKSVVRWTDGPIYLKMSWQCGLVNWPYRYDHSYWLGLKALNNKKNKAWLLEGVSAQQVPEG